MDPQTRFSALHDQANTIQVDASIPLIRYFRSGMEMLKMAKVYNEEKNWENAFILYMKFITLFLEKIRGHPQYSLHPQAEKASYNRKIKEILPLAECLKGLIKDKYQTDYDEFVEHQRILEKQLELENKKWKEKAIFREQNSTSVARADTYSAIPRNTALDALQYPSDDIGEEPENATSPVHVPRRDLKPTPTPSLPSYDRGTKPASLLGTNFSKAGIRHVVVPRNLIDIFLRLSSSNTSLNVETCGILSGRLAHNQFIITHLIVPRQVGAADSCSMLSEEELYEQQDKLDLITLGWIHTHPKMTAFLSSVDLHTHCPFQLLLPEAVAIVCAPTRNDTGFFNLTPNFGLSHISNCREQGFHPHPSTPPLFQNAAHVIVNDTMPIELVDLRR